MKVDLEQRKIVEWKEVGYSPGEPVFVPKPGAKAEDDGEWCTFVKWLKKSLVYNRRIPLSGFYCCERVTPR